MTLSVRKRFKLIIAKLMIKFGTLRYDQFTKQELNSLLEKYIPLSFPLNIPVGNAKVTLNEGEVILDDEHNRIGVQVLASISIEVADSTIYRAHLIITLSAHPHYCSDSSTLYFEERSVDNIVLVNDDYALLKDTHFLLKRFVPGQLDSLLGQSIKSALSLVTVGTSDEVLSYLTLYLRGSKQAIFEYHKPQINQAILDKLATLQIEHRMRESQWREALFSRYGKSVQVEEQHLRFYF